MELHSDFKEFLQLLNASSVDYLVVGAHALAFHGQPRYTGDLDLLVHDSRENAERLIRVIDAFGMGSLGLNAADFVGGGKVVQLGVAPVRIDLMTDISGVTWQAAWEDAKTGMLAGVSVRVAGRATLIKNKLATGRNKDLADIEALGADPQTGADRP